ncbi:MAG: PIG-L family deacetylase [Candidatus Omnitrophica bacterium]|nr:PIG-L family deacetylase [Candidatus Omnitrophota bacterium]
MKKKKILLLSPHTDDAELGAGGTIAKLLKNNKIYYAAFSICENSIPKKWPKNILEKEVHLATKLLGIKAKNLFIFKHEVRSFPEIRQTILNEIISLRKKIKPDLVIIPSGNDYHQDHQVLNKEAIRAFKTCASIICYELPWNHVDFKTDFFVQLTKEHINKKMQALKEYKSQISLKRPYFTKEFIFGLAKVRGTQCNSDYAESFEVIRWRI